MWSKEDTQKTRIVSFKFYFCDPWWKRVPTPTLHHLSVFGWWSENGYLLCGEIWWSNSVWTYVCRHIGSRRDVQLRQRFTSWLIHCDQRKFNIFQLHWINWIKLDQNSTVYHPVLVLANLSKSPDQVSSQEILFAVHSHWRVDKVPRVILVNQPGCGRILVPVSIPVTETEVEVAGEGKEDVETTKDKTQGHKGDGKSSKKNGEIFLDFLDSLNPVERLGSLNPSASSWTP